MDLAIVSHIKATDTRPALTDRQAEILAFVGEFIGVIGYPPTRADIVNNFGFKSQNAADDHLRALSRKGYLRIVPGISRGLVVLGAS